MISLIGGALVRFLPNIGSWVGEKLGLWQDAKLEERHTELQIKLETLRAKNALEVKKLDAETLMALTSLQGQIAEVQAAIQDRKSAREMAATLHRSILGTLAVGEKMQLPKWLLGFGWLMAICVEVFSAAVQPMIAATVFCAWLAWKGSMLVIAIDTTGTALQAIVAIWTIEDWMLLEAVIGFFLAGRAIVRYQTK